MESTENMFPWLGLLDRPAFCVKDGIVLAHNSAACSKGIEKGTDIRQIVTAHWDTYTEFENGCLYLDVTIGEFPCKVCVTRTAEYDIFTLAQQEDTDSLQALALAAQQLRIPLSNIMTATDRLLSDLDANVHEQQANQINRGLYQLLRIISNMSDSGIYCPVPFVGMHTVNLTAVFSEIMEKIQATANNVSVCYAGPDKPILCLADEEKLERAIYNLLSNAIKFAVPGSTIDTKLSQKSDLLSFTVCNTRAKDTQTDHFWNRYRREPAIEDNRCGLGLGMTLISNIASAHGGTVLISHPSDTETRVTMTIAIRKDNSNTVRSPKLRVGDYAGGRDKALLELADILPIEAYNNI